MTPSIDNEQIYQQAYKAYVQGNYQEAATLIDKVNLPNDPNIHLLKGNIYYALQHYDIAVEEYQKVLELTKDTELVSYAKSALQNIKEYQEQLGKDFYEDKDEQINYSNSGISAFGQSELSIGGLDNFDSNIFDFKNPDEPSVDEIDSISAESPFDIPTDGTVIRVGESPQIEEVGNPFSLNPEETEPKTFQNIWKNQPELELLPLWEQNIPSADLQANEKDSSSYSPFAQGLDDDHKLSEGENFDFQTSNFESETLFIEPAKSSADSLKNNQLADRSSNVPKDSSFGSTFSISPKSEDSFGGDESFDLEAFESVFNSESFAVNQAGNVKNGKVSTTNNNIEFLDDFDEFDDLGNIPEFDVPTGSSFGGGAINSGSLQTNGKISGQTPQEVVNHQGNAKSSPVEADRSKNRDDELFSLTAPQEIPPVFSQTNINNIQAKPNVEQGLLAPLENASLETKQWIIGGVVGVSCALVVATVSFIATTVSPSQQRESIRNTGWAMSLAAGIVGFATAGFMGNLTVKQIRRTTKDLQGQFNAVRQGNLNAQATVYSEDEFGQLSASFNEMARVIFTTTQEATRKAQEQEEAKENLQRQVIRLLDDVEGAARGDLTVQAEVTADVLGAVADAFNLTIQNLRDIVQQVKVAAREVTKGSTNSETFARALSSDALRQAEELAVTLNSVQVMTDSIQRVAEAAREAEAVARDASAIALKGGEAVENTVAGILEIRETVAETTRKVKRLAESSQEISKIVALISQIASRTNLLALNASIEAARAGEAGRGFAIVADEVRQLADRSAKSLKEIEEIVRQIQSETSSVMTAMEEGTQQVIKGTRLAEEAKRSLENIIQVANRIDILVCSITTDTVEQTETSRAVAQVMQSVELTAQETSQEAQRVSGALQHLVGVSRDLISSVERFRVETAETR